MPMPARSGPTATPSGCAGTKPQDWDGAAAEAVERAAAAGPSEPDRAVLEGASGSSRATMLSGIALIYSAGQGEAATIRTAGGFGTVRAAAARSRWVNHRLRAADDERLVALEEVAGDLDERLRPLRADGVLPAS